MRDMAVGVRRWEGKSDVPPCPCQVCLVKKKMISKIRRTNFAAIVSMVLLCSEALTIQPDARPWLDRTSECISLSAMDY